LASYYAAQTPAPGTPGDAADTAAGDVIYHRGLGDNEVPACINCHGPHAEGDANHPRLAGQHRAYLERQLAYFSANFRYSQTMHHNTRNMTETEAREVATYLAAQ
jgi:cytochrome c553